MKKLFTAALLVGLLSFSASGFAETPKEHLLFEYTLGEKKCFITTTKGTEIVTLDDKKLSEAMKKLDAFSQDGWTVQNMAISNYSGSVGTTTYVYLLVRD